ncbi:MAG TPA: D-alanyl-D-alanine carboxypeptidase family protein [Candidatus Binataceae bacterium]|nr:D-alanyl-D-alanine carboxypeptidase family protein [Candidatus Binataceae bacterium]
MLAILIPLVARPASASRSTITHHHRVHRRVHSTVPLYHAVLLEDADSGRILYQENPDLVWPPASMAKMMLLLVAEDQIKAGRMHLSDPVTISARSAYTVGSRLGLREGQVYPLGELMKAALIRSANDAAVAVAEKIGGSFEGAVRMMNLRARSLGMTATAYQTVDGLPPTPGHDVDFTSARDLATLARAIISQTDLLEWSGMEQTPFDDGVAMLHNTNHLIGHFEGCDGLKTGFTFRAGFNLTATAKRGEMRLIAVVLGAPSNPQRFAQAARFLEWGFQNYTRVAVLKGGQSLPVEVRTGSGALIAPVAAHPLSVVVRKEDVPYIHFEYEIPSVVVGQAEAGMPLGQVVVMDGADVLDDDAAICPLSTIIKQPVPDGDVSLNQAAGNNSKPHTGSNQVAR